MGPSPTEPEGRQMENLVRKASVGGWGSPGRDHKDKCITSFLLEHPVLQG